jgi:hypothetical protein
MSCTTSIEQWEGVQRQLATRGGIVTIPKATRFPHPRDAGAYATSSWPVGQIADYVLALGTGLAPLAIREFADRFEVFTDAIRLTARFIRMAEANPELATHVGAALLGGVVGTAITGRREGALVGLSLGLLVAALLNSRLQGDPSSALVAPPAPNRGFDPTHN